MCLCDKKFKSSYQMFSASGRGRLGMRLMYTHTNRGLMRHMPPLPTPPYNPKFHTLQLPPHNACLLYQVMNMNPTPHVFC